MRDRQTLVAAIIYVCCIFVVSVDMSIVNVALPTMAVDLGELPGSLSAVSTAYLLAMAVSIPASGWLGDRFGARNVILGATTLFTIASVLCGIATALPLLLGARALQGVSAGLMTPVGITLLYRLVSPAERIRMSAVISIPTSLGPALGPVLGGFLTGDLSWRWAFFINVPVGAAVVIFGALFMLPHRLPGDQHLDGVGLALAVTGLGLALFAVSEGPRRGWSDQLVVGSLVAGATVLVTLLKVELSAGHPLFEIRLLADTLFRRSSIVLGVGSLGFWSWLYLLSQFNQNVLGLDPVAAGLALLPLAAGYLVGSQLTSRVVFARIGGQRTMAVGLAALACCIAGVALVGRSTPYWCFGLLLFGSGCVVPMVFISSQTSAFMTITSASMGRASMMYSAIRQIAGALGIAFAATLVAAYSGSSFAAGGDVSAYHWVFLSTAIVVVPAAVWIGLVGRHDAPEQDVAQNVLCKLSTER